MKRLSVLLVEDNALVRVSCAQMLADFGFKVVSAACAEEAKRALAEQSFDVALLDLMLPDANGRELLGPWKDEHPDMPVIIMTAYGDIAKAVECIKAGAYDFLPKPIDRVLLESTLRHAAERTSLAREVEARAKLQERSNENLGFGSIVATGPAMKRAVDLAMRVAQSDFSCMFLHGESGTGKGLFARTLHQLGRRSQKPFVEVNCSALPATLVESELFGYTKGAFTDAKQDKEGLFELADGGTIFLDEIGDMDASQQAKLLKVIEDQSFRRLGGVRDIQVDVAVIAATHQDIEARIEEGRFRLDLFYRLNVIPIELPPLREHPEDIEPLSRRFLEVYSRKFGFPRPEISPETMRRLKEYRWPGNVRELRNVIERGCLLGGKGPITDEHLLFAPCCGGDRHAPAATPAPVPEAAAGPVPLLSMAEAEKRAILRAMDEAKNNKNEAARLLGIHRTTLYKKLVEYGIGD
ncbi:MAG: sigma-54 dependent transcriptional regulator [Lentisphaeria bacterium]|jgi:DNA-binding NtrC family response regulator|nr:sigma-54 dependent transcriptional regulator [Lentisphaeria bacterium]